MSVKPFHFKQFVIHQDQCAMKVGTDGVLLGAWCDTLNAKSILDIGTGTGVIAIMQAQRNPFANIVAVEMDDKAAEQAQQNFKLSPWWDRLAVQHDTIQQFTQHCEAKFDHIISNPPFYATENFSKANGEQRLLARNTMALNYADLMDCVAKLLTQDGKFSVVIPLSEMEILLAEAKQQGLKMSRKTLVQPKADKPKHRVLLEFTNTLKDLQENTLTIQKEKRNDFTEDYILLTKDFYTIL